MTANTVSTVKGSEVTKSLLYQSSHFFPFDSKCAKASTTIKTKPIKPTILKKSFPNIQTQANKLPITENKTGVLKISAIGLLYVELSSRVASSNTSIVPLT